MQKNIHKLDFVRLVLLALMLLIMVLIWPAGLVKTQYHSGSLEKGMAVSGSVTEDAKLMEAFTPRRDGLETIGIRVSIPNVDVRTGTLRFTLLTQEAALYTQDVPIAEIKNNQYLEFSPEVELLQEETYFYELSAFDYGENAPSVYLGSADTAAGEHMKLFYSGEEFTNNAPIVRYTYHDRAGRMSALPYLLLTAAVFGLIFAALPQEVPADED